MSLVEYSINGKYFRDFGVYVSSSSGLGEPKPKDRTVFDWKEYNGVFSDLEQKPKFQPREIEIKGFAKGENFEAVLRNIKTLFSEFKKAGKQRLLIEAQGQSALVYDVVLVGEIDPDRVYNDDEVFATYTAKLVEYLPIKKVLKLDSNVLDLKFNTPKWVEVNIDGKIYPQKGVVNINQVIENRNLTSLNFSGRNLLKNTSNITNLNYWYGLGLGETFSIQEKSLKISNGANKIGGIFQDLVNLQKGKYVISFDVKPTFQAGDYYDVTVILGGDSRRKQIHTTQEFKRYSIEFNTNAIDNLLMIIPSGSTQTLLFKNIKLEKNSESTYTLAPEEQHFITIAGNVDEITNLTTNAVELWKD